LNGKPTANLRRELLAVISCSPRKQAGEPVHFDCDRRLGTWGATYRISAPSDAEVIGRYEDGEPAAIISSFGDGRVIYLAAEICDIYAHNRRGDREPDEGRYQFLKHVAERAGVADQSWVWSVNLDNLQRVTGKRPPQQEPVDKSIAFRSYMYEHSCLHIVPWLTEGQWARGDEQKDVGK
jgi:hypothetical protein